MFKDLKLEEFKLTTSTKLINLQDVFLNNVRRENLAVVIYLVNGFQLRGVVKGFDNFTVIIENEGKQQMVYNHAVSSVISSPVAAIASVSGCTIF